MSYDISQLGLNEIESDQPNIYRVLEHPTKRVGYLGNGPSWPKRYYLYHTWTCPECGSYTESYPDCAGYGSPVIVCMDSYTDRTCTGKFVSASGCAGCEKVICINPSCNWTWRSNGSRRSGQGMQPEWWADFEEYRRKIQAAIDGDDDD